MTLRGKIALAMAVLTAVTAIIVASATYVVTDQRVRAEVDQYLDTYAQRFQDPDGRQALATCSQGTNRRTPQNVPRRDDSIEGVAFQCLDNSGEVFAAIGVDSLPVNSRDTAIAIAGRGKQIRTVESDDETWRVETVGISQGGAVQIARDYGETERVLAALRLWLSLIVVVASAVSAIVVLAHCSPFDPTTRATHRCR